MRSRLFIGILLLWAGISLLGCTFVPAAATIVSPPTAISPTPTRQAPPTSDSAQAGTPNVGARKGDIAPDFTLDSLNGDPVSLSQFRGQPVLINFWAVWCGFCRVEMPDIQKVYDAYKDQGFVVLGINVGEDAQHVEPFVQETGVTFPLLFDRDGQVMRAYRMRGLPSTIIIDADGVIRTIHIGLIDQEQLVGYLKQMGVEPL
ncbi:MAG: TlpA family protein disulfide reductase [Anaerolineae bacterium]|nr:TlpA family protein disulfide reductase [Anaerolineae bacterium]